MLSSHWQAEFPADTDAFKYVFHVCMAPSHQVTALGGTLGVVTHDVTHKSSLFYAHVPAASPSRFEFKCIVTEGPSILKIVEIQKTQAVTVVWPIQPH